MGAMRSSLKVMSSVASRNRLTAKAFEKFTRAVFNNHIHRIKSDILVPIYQATGGVVQSGSFQGLQLSQTSQWGNDMIAMLLGEYEQEVVNAIFERDLSTYSVFVDVGAANGFFAVGMALKAPLPVVAFEIDENSRTLIKENAILNGVDLDLRGEATGRAIDDIVDKFGGKALILVDIEGAELAVFDPAKTFNLSKVDMIVESHQVDGCESIDILARKFSATHHVRPIARRGRNPFRFSWLNEIDENEAWACLTEQRSRNSGWVLFEAKDAYSVFQKS